MDNNKDCRVGQLTNGDDDKVTRPMMAIQGGGRIRQTNIGISEIYLPLIESV